MAGDPQEQPSKRPSSPKVFACSNCGAGITLRALGLTVNVACPSCGSLIDATDENYRIISTVAKKTKLKPLIPLGQRGKLHGATWEVIGFMQRCDETGAYCWSEYLLFNPYMGFRWLTEYGGHWNFVVMTKERPENNRSDGIAYHGDAYKVFHRGKARVKYVLGEFYWRVKVGETVEVADFISPPRMLSLEQSAQEIVWSLAEYAEPETIKSAFDIKRPMPLRSGVAPNQPSPYGAVAPRIFKLGGVFLAVVCGIQLFTFVTAPNQVVYHQTHLYRRSDPQPTKVTPELDLPGGTSNVEVSIESPVDNSWLAVEGSLVNDRTGETDEFEQGIEFYSGYDSDGSWSEGSRRARKVFSLIPGGPYHLNFQVTAPPEVEEREFTLTVRRGVPTWSNFFWALGLLGLFPLYLGWKRHSFEVSRWSTSDYSPYVSSDD